MSTIPMIEKEAARIIKIVKGIRPISLALRGRLKMPVPIALAISANIAPLREPAFNELKYLVLKLLFGSGSTIYSISLLVVIKESSKVSFSDS